MSKSILRALTAVLLSVLAFVPTLEMPVRAQAEPQSEAWIPADFAGFVRLKIDRNTLPSLNLSLFVASFLQPGRVQFDQPAAFSRFFPLTTLDIEDASFDTDVLPWLSGDVVIAYRRFDDRMHAASADTLLILPTVDLFQSTAAFAHVLKGQDFLKSETYRNLNLFIGDQTAMAFTPGAVMIGAEEVVKAAMDVQAGKGERLIDAPAYARVRAAIPAESRVFAYVDGDDAVKALTLALGSDDSGATLLATLGEVLRDHRAGAFETMLLNGGVEALGVGIQPDVLNFSSLAATVVAALPDAPADDSASAFDPSVLTLIPRSAMVVQSGADSVGAFYDATAALPLSSFAARLLGGFPLPAASASTSGEPPTADHVRAALDGFQTVLEQIGGVKVEDDLLDHLGGSYAVALLPRPNNPSPLTNTPYDLLLVAKVSDGEKALDGASKLAQQMFALPEYAQQTVEGVTFTTLTDTRVDEPLLSLGVVDDTLVIGTGTAAELALRARGGDNRLINQPRWQAVSDGDTPPSLYLDLNALYNTFLPTAGGVATRGVSQLGVNAGYLEDGLYRIQVTITLPQ